MAGLVADELGLDETQRDVLRVAALVYDIGKVGIPVELLNRRGELTAGEKSTIRRHPEIGMRLLESTMRLHALAPVDPAPPRALGRGGLPRRTEGRGDPVRGAGDRHLRRLAGHGERPSVPAGAHA